MKLEQLLAENVNLRQIVQCCNEDRSAFVIRRVENPRDGSEAYIVWQEQEGEWTRAWYAPSDSSWFTWTTVDHRPHEGASAIFNRCRYHAPEEVPHYA